jgi:hypothetical protein
MVPLSTSEPAAADAETSREEIGMTLSDRQAQMGHGDVRMTLHYTHSDLNRRRESIETMTDRLITEPVTSTN